MFLYKQQHPAGGWTREPGDWWTRETQRTNESPLPVQRVRSPWPTGEASRWSPQVLTLSLLLQEETNLWSFHVNQPLFLSFEINSNKCLPVGEKGTWCCVCFYSAGFLWTESVSPGAEQSRISTLKMLFQTCEVVSPLQMVSPTLGTVEAD